MIPLEMDATAVHRRFLYWASAVFGMVVLLLAFSPHDYADWALENALVGLLVAALLITARWLPCLPATERNHFDRFVHFNSAC